MLRLLFNSKLTHGCYPKELVKTIKKLLSYPFQKTNQLVYLIVTIIEVFNSINKLFDYVIIDLCGDTLLTSRCNLVSNLSIPQYCVLLY